MTKERLTLNRKEVGMTNPIFPGRWKYVPARPHPASIKPLDLSPKFRDISPPIVDLRPTIRRLSIAIRQQPRGNCAVHAVTFLHEYMYATRLLSDACDLSEEYIEYVTFTIEKPAMKGGENFWALDIGYQKWGVCPESLVPTQSQLVSNVSNEILEAGKKWARLTPDFIKNWDPNTGATENQLGRAVSYLDQNTPVAMGVLWPKNWRTKLTNGVDLMEVPSAENVFDGHAVVLVGYGRHSSFPGGGYFIFRNSWNGWGENNEGYGYMPFDYVLKYANDLLAYKPTDIKLNIGPIKAATWVHGTIAEAEFPDRLTEIQRKGGGTTFLAKAGTTNWFHIPITTPVILDGVRPQLTKIFVLYQAGSDSMITKPHITSLHIYDGKNKVKSFDGIDLSGDHSGVLDASNTWHISPPLTIYSGLGISVGVAFPSGPNKTYGISFATIGADFNSP